MLSENLEEEENFCWNTDLDVEAIAGPEVEKRDSSEVEEEQLETDHQQGKNEGLEKNEQELVSAESIDDQELEDVEAILGNGGQALLAPAETIDHPELEQAAEHCYNLAVDGSEVDENSPL